MFLASVWNNLLMVIYINIYMYTRIYIYVQFHSGATVAPGLSFAHSGDAVWRHFGNLLMFSEFLWVSLGTLWAPVGSPGHPLGCP